MNKTEEAIYLSIKQKTKNISSKEVKRIIEDEVRKRNYLREDWQIHYAIERIKEMIDEDVKNKIHPLSFKEEMGSPYGRIIFTITTLWLIFCGIMVFLYLFGIVQISGRVIPIFLMSLIGGISFIIRQIFKDGSQKGK